MQDYLKKIENIEKIGENTDNTGKISFYDQKFNLYTKYGSSSPLSENILQLNIIH